MLVLEAFTAEIQADTRHDPVTPAELDAAFDYALRMSWPAQLDAGDLDALWDASIDHAQLTAGLSGTQRDAPPADPWRAGHLIGSYLATVEAQQAIQLDRWRVVRDVILPWCIKRGRTATRARWLAAIQDAILQTPQ